MRLAAALTILLITSESLAGVSESVRFVYYDVTTDGSKDLRTLLNESTTIRHQGELYHGYTDWYVSWKFRWTSRADGRCHIESVATTLTANITLPRSADAAVAHRTDFATYLAALRRHEDGHLDIARRTADSIDRQILAMPEATSCLALGNAANRLGQQLLQESRHREIRYDQDTKHGESQGARL